MAHIAETLSSQRQGGYFAGLLAQLSDSLQRRRVYNKTYSELAKLSTRELNDLGISRSMISRLAQEAAYGK